LFIELQKKGLTTGRAKMGTEVSDDEIEDMSYKVRMDTASSIFREANSLLKGGDVSLCQKLLSGALRYLFDVDSDSPKAAQVLKLEIVTCMQQVCLNFSSKYSHSFLVEFHDVKSRSTSAQN
jgi:hypothetical protein